MRVIAGSLGGRRLKAPSGTVTRPTSDRVRESLFGMLGDIEGARVLDLFAGTGALGIEAASRGAAFVLFVDDGVEARSLLSVSDLQSPAVSGRDREPARPRSVEPCYPPADLRAPTGDGTEQRDTKQAEREPRT